MNYVGENIAWETIDEGRTLLLRIDLTAQGHESGSGKSMVFASTRGNKKLQLDGGDEIVVGINCYRKTGGKHAERF